MRAFGRNVFARTGFRGGRRRRRGAAQTAFFVLVLLLAVSSVLLFLHNVFWSGDRHRVRETVKAFYDYERSGDYGSAWELLHSGMKEHFAQDAYIQARTTFYSLLQGGGGMAVVLGKPEQVAEWRMADNAPVLRDVYRITVEQRMLSVFGGVAVRQDVFAAEENGEWRLLWSYQEPMTD